MAIPAQPVSAGDFAWQAANLLLYRKHLSVRCRNGWMSRNWFRCERHFLERESPFPDSRRQEFLAGRPDAGIVVQANRRFVRRNLWLLECFRCVGSSLALCHQDAGGANSDALADDAPLKVTPFASRPASHRSSVLLAF